MMSTWEAEWTHANHAPSRLKNLRSLLFLWCPYFCSSFQGSASLVPACLSLHPWCCLPWSWNSNMASEGLGKHQAPPNLRSFKLDGLYLGFSWHGSLCPSFRIQLQYHLLREIFSDHPTSKSSHPSTYPPISLCSNLVSSFVSMTAGIFSTSLTIISTEQYLTYTKHLILLKEYM